MSNRDHPRSRTCRPTRTTAWRARIPDVGAYVLPPELGGRSGRRRAAGTCARRMRRSARTERRSPGLARRRSAPSTAQEAKASTTRKANRLQGEHPLSWGWAHGRESSGIGYAPWSAERSDGPRGRNRRMWPASCGRRSMSVRPVRASSPCLRAAREPRTRDRRHEAWSRSRAIRGTACRAPTSKRGKRGVHAGGTCSPPGSGARERLPLTIGYTTVKGGLGGCARRVASVRRTGAKAFRRVRCSRRTCWSRRTWSSERAARPAVLASTPSTLRFGRCSASRHARAWSPWSRA